MMRRKKVFAAIFLLSLFVLSCATTHQVTMEVIPDSARIENKQAQEKNGCKHLFSSHHPLLFEASYEIVW